MTTNQLFINHQLNDNFDLIRQLALDELEELQLLKGDILNRAFVDPIQLKKIDIKILEIQDILINLNKA